MVLTASLDCLGLFSDEIGSNPKGEVVASGASGGHPSPTRRWNTSRSFVLELQLDGGPWLLALSVEGTEGWCFQEPETPLREAFRNTVV